MFTGTFKAGNGLVPVPAGDDPGFIVVGFLDLSAASTCGNLVAPTAAAATAAATEDAAAPPPIPTPIGTGFTI